MRHPAAQCAACWFWQRLNGREDDPTMGDCRRMPPQVLVVEGVGMASVFPNTRETDWCGEFQVP